MPSAPPSASPRWDRATARRGFRTYNFPQGRVTDHRVNLTLYKLERVMDGDLDELIEALIADDQASRLAEQP